MRVFIALLSIFFTFFTFSACEKEIEVPTCIDQQLEIFKTEACLGGDLTTWQFNGRTVYCFFYGSCAEDPRADIYEADCTLICSLFGMSGNTECEGIDWDDNAQKEETIFVQE